MLATFSSPARKSLTKLSLGGNNLIFPPRESLVSDFPAGDLNVANLFLQYIIGLCELHLGNPLPILTQRNAGFALYLDGS